MLKNISNLGKTLNKAEQKEIQGGLFAIVESCNVGCAGKSHGSSCFASANCNCPGKCANSTTGGCIPF